MSNRKEIILDNYELIDMIINDINKAKIGCLERLLVSTNNREEDLLIKGEIIFADSQITYLQNLKKEAK